MAKTKRSVGDSYLHEGKAAVVTDVHDNGIDIAVFDGQDNTVRFIKNVGGEAPKATEGDE